MYEYNNTLSLLSRSSSFCVVTSFIPTFPSYPRNSLVYIAYHDLIIKIPKHNHGWECFPLKQTVGILPRGRVGVIILCGPWTS